MPKINAAGIVSDATLDEDPDFAQPVPVDEPVEADESDGDSEKSGKPAPKRGPVRK